MPSAIPRRLLGYLFRILCALCALAAVWAVVLWLTGGFHVEYAGFRISSQRPRNAAVISLLVGMLVLLLTFSPNGRDTFRGEWSRWRLRWASIRRRRPLALHIVSIASSTGAIALALIGLDIYQHVSALPLWVDEEMIALNVRDRSVADLAGVLWLGQSAPFGWLVLERMAMTILGTGEAAMRAVPLLFGIATVGVAAWCGQRWMGRIAAVAFVLLCWVGPLLSHYRFEVKHYSADVFFGLLLPALAAWAIETDSSAGRFRRVWLWWVAAALGHWLANGALLVTPACAIFLCVWVWRRDGTRAASWFSLGGLMWLASFGLHYAISLRYTLNNPYLRSMWVAEMLPASIGLTGSLRWILDRLEPLAFNPGGTSLWTLLWASAVCGWAFGIRRPLGLVLAGVPLSAFAVAAIVPLHQRFSIWIVPALYAGVALLIDRGVGVCRDAFDRRRWALLTIGALVLLVQFQLFSDILTNGRRDIRSRLVSIDKQHLDDRAAVRWLMSQWTAGDVLMTTHLTLPAVWWYGMIPISDEAGSGSVLHDGSPVYEAHSPADCRPGQFQDALENHRRVLLYLGFEIDLGLEHTLLRNLDQLGGMTAHREFSRLGRVAVIDRRAAAGGGVMQLSRDTTGGVEPRHCIAVRRAVRW